MSSLIIKINNFWGEQTDVLAITKTLGAARPRKIDIDTNEVKRKHIQTTVFFMRVFTSKMHINVTELMMLWSLMFLAGRLQAKFSTAKTVNKCWPMYR